jgi:two-component system LytT family sensor kinase
MESGMSNLHEPIVVNIIGHTTGAIIFGIFLFLFLRDRSGSAGRGSWLSAEAAGLAFLWNAGSLMVLLAIHNASPASSFLIAITFCCLSLLPPVLLQLSLEGQMPVLVAVGYSLALIAVAMHCAAAITGKEAYGSNAFLLITVGFVVLTAVSVTRIAKRHDQRSKTSRVVASMCLLLFSMSFVHFGTGHPLHAWSSEAALHHGGIPLALLILMQDYRFVLLDAFIRFLANALLAAAVTVAAVEAAVALKLMGPVDTARGAILVLGVCVLLIVFAIFRSLVQRWLTEAVFRRPNLENLLQQIRTRSDWRDESEFMSWAASQVATFMKSERWTILPKLHLAPAFDGPDFPTPVSEAREVRNHEEYRWAEAVVPLRLSFGEVTHLLLGRRQGGRRYFSEDFRALGRLATAITEQIERYHDSEMQKLVVDAELRALQSQINPHFLFNALNTLYGVIPREAAGARRTVLNLADIFRYSLQTPDKLISLADELEIVRAYLEIEKLRLGTRLRVEIDADEALSNMKIPVLSIQPLVENSSRHGVS